MLILIALYAYIWYISYNWGALFNRFILRVPLQNKAYNFLTGLVYVSVFSRIWSLGAAVGKWHTVLLMLIALLNTKQFIPELKKLVNKQTGMLCLLALPVVFFCSQQSISYDEAMYHASFIQWMNDFGIVKGLGNLHGRLAFNSTWHLLAAGFNMQWVSGTPFNQLNGLMLLWFIAFFQQEVNLHKNISQVKVFSLVAVICLFFPPVFVYHIIDPSSDFIVCFVALLVLYETYFFEQKGTDKAMPGILLMLCFWLVTVKVSSLSILLVIICLGKRFWQYRSALWLPGGIVALIMLSWLASGFLLSGYILYPSLKLGSVPWQVPHNIAQMDVDGIKYSPFMRWIKVDQAAVEHMGFAEKYLKWFRSIRIYDKVLFLSGFLAHIILLLRYRKLSSIKLQTVLVSLAGFLFVVLTAPDFRFAAGYVFFILALLLSEITWVGALVHLGKLSAAAAALLFAGAFLLYGHLKREVPVTPAGNTKKLSLQLIAPVPYPKTSFTPVMVNGMLLHYYNESEKQYNWNNNPGTYDPTLKVNVPGNNPGNGIFPSPQAAVR